VARRVGWRQVDDDGADAVQDAGLHLRDQRQADVAGMDAAAQPVPTGSWRASRRRCEPPGNSRRVRPSASCAATVASMTTPASSAKAAGRSMRLNTSLSGAAGDDPAFVEEDQMVGQAGDFVGGVADVDDRDGQFAVQAFQVGQDFLLALEVERGQRLVHQQDFRAQRAGRGRWRRAGVRRRRAGWAMRSSRWPMPSSSAISGRVKRQMLRSPLFFGQIPYCRAPKGGGTGWLPGRRRRARAVGRQEKAAGFVLPDLVADGEIAARRRAPARPWRAGRWSCPSRSGRTAP
jgi:hypothetical protein